MYPIRWRMRLGDPRIKLGGKGASQRRNRSSITSSSASAISTPEVRPKNQWKRGGNSTKPKIFVEIKDVIINCLNWGVPLEKAVKIAGVNKKWITYYQNADPELSEAIDQVLALGAFEILEEVRRRAFNGSDRVLIFLASKLVDELRNDPTPEQKVLYDRLIQLLIEELSSTDLLS